MKKNNLKRFLASLLAVLMLASVTGVSPAVFAAGNDAAAQSEETAAPVFQEYTGEVLIKSDYDNDAILKALADAFVQNKDSVDISAINWTYKYAVKGTYKKTKYDPITYDTDKAREAKVPVLTGLTVTESYCYYKAATKYGTDLYADATYVYPALAANADGFYELYANGKSVGTINKVSKLKSAINVNNEVATIAIPYTGATEYDVNALNESIFNAYVTSTIPAGLTYDKLSYTGTVAKGQQTITISYAGDEDHYGTNAPVTVNFVDNRIDTFSLKDKPETLNIGYAGNSINIAETENQIRKQLVNQLAADVDLSAVKVEYKNAFGKYAELNKLAIETYSLTDTDIRLTYAGDATHKPFTAIVNDIKFADNRIASSIVLKDGASITYNMKAETMIEEIVKNAIDWEKSELPADAAASDFTVKYKALPQALEDKADDLEKYKVFVPIGGRKGATKLTTFDQMGAGEQVIQISYNGNSDYRPSEDVEGNLTVKKADVKVSIPLIAKIYAGEPLETKENPYATLDPNDPAIDIYKFFVGENSNLQSVAYIDLPASKTKLIDAISDAQVEYLGYAEKDTIRGKLQNGVTIGELKAAMTEIVDYASKDPLTKFFVNAMLKKYGITVDNLKDLVDTLNTITKIADNFKIAIGTPDHAGAYFAFVIAVNDNYNPAYAAGSLIVLKNWKNIKLEKNPVLNSGDKANTINVSQAEELKAGNNLCILTKDGTSLNSASAGSIHYWFTGVGKIYAKSTMPTAPGKYIVTASVRGGDFFAFPKTFSFTIVADPTPEVTPNA